MARGQKGMTVSKKVKLASSVALLLVFIFGWPLVQLFPPSTTGRILSLLFVTIVGSLTGYITLFARTVERTEEDKQIGFWIDMDDGSRTEFSKKRCIKSVEEMLDALMDYKKGLKEIGHE